MSNDHERPPGCLDAETMAAWVDRALPGAQAAVAEAHVADCTRCQAMLAVLVRTIPAEAPLAPWWRRRWALGALVPIAGGALALALWIATPRVSQAPVSPVTTIASAPSSAVAPAPTVGAESSRVQPSAQADRVEKVPQASDSRARAKVASPAVPAEARKESTAATDVQLRRADAAPAPTTVAPATPAPPPPSAAPAAEARQAMPARALGLTLNRLEAGVDIVSPDPSVRWRIGAAGSVQRSADGGATWVAQASAVAQDLTAGTSPQRGVCWVVGRAGAVLLFTDGSSWRRLEFPEAVDLAGIEARDAVIATVTTADGRRFQTADGGRTWGPVQDF